MQNAFLSQIENGHVALPNVDLLANLAQIYSLDFWNLMWRAGYRVPKEPPASTSPDEDGTPLNIQSLEDLTEDELREVLGLRRLCEGTRAPPAPGLPLIP